MPQDQTFVVTLTRPGVRDVHFRINRARNFAAQFSANRCVGTMDAVTAEQRVNLLLSKGFQVA